MNLPLFNRYRHSDLQKEGVEAPRGMLFCSNWSALGDYGLLRSASNDILRLTTHYPINWRRFNTLRAIINVAWDAAPPGAGPYIFGQSFMFHPDGDDCDPNNAGNWQYWRNNIDIPVPVPVPTVRQTLSYDWAINLPPSFLVNKGDLMAWQIDENLGTATASLRVYAALLLLL